MIDLFGLDALTNEVGGMAQSAVRADSRLSVSPNSIWLEARFASEYRMEVLT